MGLRCDLPGLRFQFADFAGSDTRRVGQSGLTLPGRAADLIAGPMASRADQVLLHPGCVAPHRSSGPSHGALYPRASFSGNTVSDLFLAGGDVGIGAGAFWSRRGGS